MKMTAIAGNQVLDILNDFTDITGFWGTGAALVGAKKIKGSGKPYRFILYNCATGQFSREVYELCA